MLKVIGNDIKHRLCTQWIIVEYQEVRSELGVLARCWRDRSGTLIGYDGGIGDGIIRVPVLRYGPYARFKTAQKICLAMRRRVAEAEAGVSSAEVRI
jgi:hypothetical protein